jgi:membrane-associated phospholipid phosphatase
MDNGSVIKRIAAAALLCACLVTLSVAFVDRPVERLVANNVLDHYHRLLFFDVMASPSLLALPGACTYLVFYALCYLVRRTNWLRSQLFLQLSVAVAVATLAKDELKWLFGRPWPTSWVEDGIYKIHPFTNNFFYGSFPSGHTSVSAAPMFVLWWCLPKYRPLWLAIVFSVMIGLVGSGHHYVGDVTAGFFLGLAVGTGTVAAWPNPPASAKQEALLFLKKKKQKDFFDLSHGR